METIRCVLGFDMETDIGSWTPFYEGIVKGTPAILDLLSIHEAEATFFFTGDAAVTHTKVVRDVIQAGYEVGCHSLYHETLGDELFPIPGVKPLLPEEVHLRIKRATEFVEQAAGSKVVSFRAPRLWGSTKVVQVLESLGYLADASYPLYYYRERLAPYRPNRGDWTKEGDMQLLEIPNFADMSMETSDPYGRDCDQWPLFRTEGAAALMEHVDAFIDWLCKRDVDPVVLCFYFHPWEFVAMPEGSIHYGEGSVIPDAFIVKNCGDEAIRQLDSLLGELKKRDACFMTARSLAQEYGLP